MYKQGKVARETWVNMKWQPHSYAWGPATILVINEAFVSVGKNIEQDVMLMSRLTINLRKHFISSLSSEKKCMTKTWNKENYEVEVEGWLFDEGQESFKMLVTDERGEP